MVLGSLGAVAAGAALPVFTIIFGSLINAFNPDGPEVNFTAEINKICLQFVYVAIGTIVASYFEVNPRALQPHCQLAHHCFITSQS